MFTNPFYHLIGILLIIASIPSCFRGKEDDMAVDYMKLWKLLLDKGMKKTDLKTKAGISSNVLAKLRMNKYVSMETTANSIL